ncbi:hypothetical protein ACEPAG_6766 [Sanghuangporus baumii]
MQEAIRTASNVSAPGLSGIGYRPLKWLITEIPGAILTLFNDCLRLGHHPRVWRAAKVVMIHKPNKKDPFSPRAYRPITLEETLGKVLEKMMANHLQYLANTEHWLPPNQFGGCQGHAVHDAAISLAGMVKTAWRRNLKCSALAVDIQGFFDKVEPAPLCDTLDALGCPQDTNTWVLSFMCDREVALAFDGTTLDPQPKPNVGTPQGSPVSPILATIYARKALEAAQRIPRTGILAYVDNHLIVTWSNDYKENCRVLAKTCRLLQDQLRKINMDIEADKTEAIHFQKP